MKTRSLLAILLINLISLAKLAEETSLKIFSNAEISKSKMFAFSKDEEQKI
jgi:hypothetical protein